MTDCDWFVTADKAFKEIIEKCRIGAPVRLAVVHLVPGGADAVKELFEVLDGRKSMFRV